MPSQIYPIKTRSYILTDDKALLDYLANYETDYCQSNCPPILLARTFRVPLDKRPFDPNTEPYYLEQRHTFLDNVVARSPHLYWAATLFEREHDRILRRWQLWTATCTQNASDIVPSMPLLAITLLVGTNQPSPSSHRLKNHLNYYAPLDCTKGPQTGTNETRQHKSTTFKLNDNLTFNLQPTRLSRRILYTLPWYLNKGEWSFIPYQTEFGNLRNGIQTLVWLFQDKYWIPSLTTTQLI